MLNRAAILPILWNFRMDGTSHIISSEILTVLSQTLDKVLVADYPVAEYAVAFSKLQVAA